MSNDLLTPLIGGLERRAQAIARRAAAAAAAGDPLVVPLADATAKQAGSIATALGQLGSEVLANPSSLESYRSSFRAHAQELVLLERFFLAPCERFTRADAALTRLMATLVSEANLPIKEPTGVLASQASYFSQRSRGDRPYGVVFVPAAENSTLLGLPALGHELGHLLEPEALVRFGTTVSDAMQSAMDAWPLASVDVVTARDTWELRWAREFACDGIAAYVLGPAYAWQWLRLIAHTSEPPFSPGLGQHATHPAAAARFGFVLAILQHVSGNSTKALSDSWAKAVIGSHRPDGAYKLAYPDRELAAAGVALAEHCLRLVFTPYPSAGAGSVCAILNTAWNRLLRRPASFAAWEATKLATVLPP